MDKPECFGLGKYAKKGFSHSFFAKALLLHSLNLPEKLIPECKSSAFAKQGLKTPLSQI
jgi:hypothetical protein